MNTARLTGTPPEVRIEAVREIVGGFGPDLVMGARNVSLAVLLSGNRGAAPLS